MIFSSLVIFIFSSLTLAIDRFLLAPVRSPYPIVAYLGLGMSLVALALVLWLFLIYFRSKTLSSTPVERILNQGAYAALGLQSFAFLALIVRGVLALAADFSPEGWVAIHETHLVLGCLVAIPALLIWGRIQAALGPRIVPVHLSTDKFSQTLKIAHLSDLHIGNTIGETYVEQVVSKTNALAPDLIVLTGDIADGDPNGHDPELAVLSRLRARYGIYYVTGNHEFYWNEAGWREQFSRLGFQVLDNSSQSIALGDREEIRVLGVSDLKPDYAKTFRGVPNSSYRLLLAHHPGHEKEAGPHGFDLQLSGHTHGGQFIPWSWIIGLVHRYAAGTYHRPDGVIHVNVGTGYWGPPIRLGTRSEITEIVIQGRYPVNQR